MTPLLLSLAAAPTATPTVHTLCAPFVTPLSAVSTARDARMVRAASGHATSPAQVRLVLADAGWRLVWAVPDDSERGVWFFRRSGGGFRLADTWGGVALDSERGEVAAWAVRLGVPSPLARCFAALGINYEQAAR